MNKKKMSTISKKIIIAFSCICIPFFTIYYSLYFYTLNNHKQLTTATFTAQSDDYLADWDSIIASVINIMNYCMSAENLTTLSQIPESINTYEKVSKINQVADNIQMLTYGSDFVENSYFLIKDIEKCISADGKVRDFSKNQFIAEMELLRKHENIFYFEGEYSNPTQMSIGMFTPPSIYNSEYDSSYIFKTNFSLSNIKVDLNKFCYIEGSTAMLYFREAGYAVSSDDNQILFDALEDNVRSGELLKKISLEGQEFQLFYNQSDAYGIYIINAVPINNLYPFLPTFEFFNIVFLATAILVFFVSLMKFNKIIRKPIRALISKFENTSGSLHSTLPEVQEAPNTKEFENLYESYNRMTRRINHLINEVYLQTFLKQKAEFKQLQNQVNPHFLYNSFLTLSLLSRSEDIERISEFSQKLSEYFRYITRDSADEVELKKEFEHGKRYVEIQKIRFSNRLQILYEEVPAGYEATLIPRLIIQPILENCFKHGLESVSEDAILKMSWESSEEYIILHIDDNGNSPNEKLVKEIEESFSSPKDEQEISGLMNINKRLQLKYQTPYINYIEIKASPLNGCRVSLKIRKESE